MKFKHAIADNMEKRIIGFKLIKEYPYSPKIGDEITIRINGNFWEIRKIAYSEKSLLNKYSEFWQPIYEEEKVISLDKIIEEGGTYTNLLYNQAKSLMRITAEETIDFVIDYLRKNTIVASERDQFLLGCDLKAKIK